MTATGTGKITWKKRKAASSSVMSRARSVVSTAETRMETTLPAILMVMLTVSAVVIVRKERMKVEEKRVILNREGHLPQSPIFLT